MNFAIRDWLASLKQQAEAKNLEPEAHTAFIVEWLAQYLPETLPPTDGFL